MDLSVKTIEIDRRGKEGLICNDNIRADINVTFFVRVNKTRDDVLKVAQSIGCVRASDPKTLEELFTAKFAEALKTVGKHFKFEELYTKRDDFKDKIIKVIGKDLNGFILDDARSTTSSRRRSRRSTKTTSWTRTASARSPRSRSSRT